MDWTQVLTIIGSLGAFTFYLLTRVDKDIKDLSERLDEQAKRFDLQFQAQSQRIDVHSQRTDQLYQMFIDLLKHKEK